ncbi:hypothetical protein MLD38_005343 [Melastoma candidum]|uniref:Uncharacterized protein n=1 Tax=Melastoma candidum TaxID=119954 RepID=A0ACB9SBT8_9MYRT|nr:hypothetical protein MLD38_005343 [Melastoma candidum]
MEEWGRSQGKKKILLTSLSAMAAETSTFPIDLIKTRLQLHTSLPSSPSSFRILSDILRRQGPLALYQGLSPALLRHLFYTPVRIVAYEYLRNCSRSSSEGDEYSLPLPAKAFIGGVSGVIAQVIASPADLVKVRMQADGLLVSQGISPRYSGPVDAFQKIIHAAGIAGLWKGVLPNAQRAFLVNMGELACYDQAKQFFIRNRVCEDNIYAHTLASIMSGLSATALSCPADVVKTRMMNQAADSKDKVRYRNSYDCLVKTVRLEGPRALWKGFFPTWARLGPWQFVFWVSYEKLRKVAGMPSF